MATTPAHEMFKPRDVEELIDYYFHRPLAARLVRILLPTSITPNQITVAACAVGSASGFAFYAGGHGSSLWVLLGAVLVFSSIILDCSDGQLARVRGTASMFGRAMDGVSDYFPTISAFYGLAFFMDMRFQAGWPGWIMGYAAGASMIWHCFLYDNAKNIYLSNTKPPVEDGSTGLVLLDEVCAELDRLRRGRRWVLYGLFWTFYANTVLQHRSFKGEQPPDRALTETAEEREIYRAELLLSMRLWSFLGLGTHLFLLVVSALAAAVDPHAPIAVWLLMAGPMNVLTVYLLATDPARRRRAHERIRARRGGVAHIDGAVGTA